MNIQIIVSIFNTCLYHTELIEEDIDDLLDVLKEYDTPSKPLSHPVAGEKPSDPSSMLPPGMDMLGESFDPSHLEELNSMMEGMLGKDLLEEYQAFSKELEENLPDMFNLQGLEVKSLLFLFCLSVYAILRNLTVRFLLNLALSYFIVYMCTLFSRNFVVTGIYK